MLFPQASSISPAPLQKQKSGQASFNSISPPRRLKINGLASFNSTLPACLPRSLPHSPPREHGLASFNSTSPSRRLKKTQNKRPGFIQLNLACLTRCLARRLEKWPCFIHRLAASKIPK
jgi:hypothetical protein